MKKLTVAVCSFNRANRLPTLINSLSLQKCPIPFEIVVIDNNSTDNTEGVVRELSQRNRIPLLYIKEARHGIVHARNCAIENSMDSKYLAFIDDDELPEPNWLAAAVDAFESEGAECVGGEIRVIIDKEKKPDWLNEELIKFLGENRWGNEPFWITTRSTPIWSGNIAYKTSIFSNGLRYDIRYNRIAHDIGGGEDAAMFETLLRNDIKIRYRPDMVVGHYVEDWKLQKRYFIKLHFKAGITYGRYLNEEYKKEILGIPPFMLNQMIRQWYKTILCYIKKKPGALRQAMNATHSLGMIIGRYKRWKIGRI
jgi:glycosyltransferase involved in cell wall biosynthesis